MVARYFMFGSEWLYLKIYSGPKTIEDIFITVLTPKIQFALNRNIIDSFFFIRYQDPDYHIRLRFHLSSQNSISILSNMLNEALKKYIENHIIIKFQVETYVREIERYGVNNILDVEKIFFLDSSFIVQYLFFYNCEDNRRWEMSMKFINMFLCKYIKSIEDIISFVEKNSENYLKEQYNNNKSITKILNKKYQKIRDKIDTILKKNDDIHWEDKILYDYIENTKLSDSLESKDLYSILTSIIHMHVNRMFRSNQRITECVIYFYLKKYYKSLKYKY